MIITKKTPITTIDLWHPRYHDKRFLLACYKVSHALPTVVITFSKSKSQQGLRYALPKSKIMTYPIVFNGKIDCYAVPQADWETVDTPADVFKELTEMGWL